MTLDPEQVGLALYIISRDGGSWWPHEPSEQAGIDQKVWMAAVRSMRRCNGGAFFGQSALPPDPGPSVTIYQEAIMKNYTGILGGICLMLLLLILALLVLTSVSQAADCTTMAAGSISRLECEGLAAKIDQQRKAEAALVTTPRTIIHSPELDEVQLACGDITDPTHLAACRREVGAGILRRRAEAYRQREIEYAKVEAEQERWAREHRTTTCSTSYGYRYTSTSCSSF